QCLLDIWLGQVSVHVTIGRFLVYFQTLNHSINSYLHSICWLVIKNKYSTWVYSLGLFTIATHVILSDTRTPQHVFLVLSMLHHMFARFLLKLYESRASFQHFRRHQGDYPTLFEITATLHESKGRKE
ncbi:hypothetical protein ACJX0J_012621, partial [Zea mays]